MSAEELRSFVQGALEQLDDKPRTALVDALISRAAKGSSGWKPTGPAREIIQEVETFTDAVRRIGYAEPHQVDDYLRQGTKAFLRGDYAAARAIYQALLLPIAEAEIDLGQDELVDEVLTVSVHACAAQYLVTVYATTPLEARAEALCQAIVAVDGIATFWEPLGEMERVAAGPLPELDAFLPLWLARVEREPTSESDWDSDRDRWLREAAERLEGVAGLERLARKTKRPEALRAWCSALAERGEWADALGAYEEAVKLWACLGLLGPAWACLGKTRSVFELRRPVEYDRHGSCGLLHAEQETLAVGRDVVATEATTSGLEPGLKERPRAAHLEGIARAVRRHRHERSIESEIKELFSIRTPSRLIAAARRDLPLARPLWKRTHEQIEPSRFLGGMRVMDLPLGFEQQLLDSVSARAVLIQLRTSTRPRRDVSNASAIG